jgi:hypothetical protein
MPITYIAPNGANINPRHAAALELAQRGIPVTPCKVGGKEPITRNGFKDRTKNIELINHWWSQGDWNIGVCPADLGWIALDLDHHKEQPAGLRHLCEKGVDPIIMGMLPMTRFHRTPSGGEHRFYKTTETFGNHKFAVNVDVRSADGYVLWPPSVVNGVEYQQFGPNEPTEFPERLAKTMRDKRAQTEATDCPDTGVDAMLEEAEAYCKGLVERDEHPGRYQLAGALVRNFGLTNYTATELCHKYWLRMEPSNGKTTWEATLNNVRKYGKGELGKGVAWQGLPDPDPNPSLFDGYLALERAREARDPSLVPADQIVGWETNPAPVGEYDDPLDTPSTSMPILAGSEKGQAILAKMIAELGEVAPEPNKARRFHRRRPSEAKDQPPMVCLDADNLFPSGPRLMVIYAEMANLKTQFVLAKALEIFNRTGGRVLYLAAEDGHGIDTQRLPAYVERRGIDWPTLDEHWWPISEPIDLIRDGAQLTADVKAEGFAPDVVVIDVMTACTGALDINLPGVGNSLMNAAQLIANAFGALVVLLTHPGKEGGSRGPVGSYAFTARADVVLLLKRQGDTLDVTVEKMKGGPGGHTVAFAVETPNGLPLVGSCRAKERRESPTSDEAIFIHLIAARAVDFASGLTDEQLAERIVGERQPNEEGHVYATRVTRTSDALKKRHKKTKYGENATMSGGKQLYWRWHLGPKVPTDTPA